MRSVLIAAVAMVAFCAIVIIGLSAMVGHDKLARQLLWRYELLTGRPTISQRIVEQHRWQMFRIQDRSAAPGAVLMFGDSHLERLPAQDIAKVHRFAIGGLAVARLVDQLSDFASLKTARIVILNGGANDLAESRTVAQILADWQRMLEAIPPGVSVVCVAIPVSRFNGSGLRTPQSLNDAIEAVNDGIVRLCSQSGKKVIRPVMGEGFIPRDGIDADGVHLTLGASRALVQAIEQAIGEDL